MDLKKFVHGFEIFIGWRDDPEVIYRIKKPKLCMRCKRKLRLANAKYGYYKR